MNKKQFFRNVMKHVPTKTGLIIEVSPPAYWWEKTYAIELCANIACFPCVTREAKKTRYCSLGGAHSEKSAKEKANKYRKWAREYKLKATE